MRRLPVPLKVIALSEDWCNLSNDNNKLKEYQQPLLETQERFKELITSIQDMVFTLDVTGCCTGFYGQWAAKSGLLNMGNSCGRLDGILGDSYDEFENDILPKVLKGQDMMYDCRLGEVMGGKQAQISLSPIYDEEGRISGAVGVGRDVTVQNMVLEALRESENMYRGLVETTPYGIILTDLTGQIQMVNQQSAYLHEFGDSEEMIGKNLFSLLEPGGGKRIHELFSKVIEEGKAHRAECNLLTNGGKSFLSEIMTSLILCI